MRAKYCQEQDFWEDRRLEGVSRLWRKMNNLKANIRSHIIWEVVHGINIQVVNRP
jgi:hypothetical protein